MLKLVDIRKAYTTGDFTQVALDGVSLSFRDNEFVAILGPSGSGKTTLLNIIGGLDHYDSGDLIIDGVSTKNYKDRDWDTFRNNRIGFVFQSYNLIPHQTVLSNVELALTLSGVGREERKKRAIEALEKVGLGEHVNKRPNQLSGGQMQRVAIARALINDPEILLADEPTGALDSKTSVQIMDLLTEIANDRLVVMVTHNPELADEYATRIVNLADGHIVHDTDPFFPTDEEMKLSQKKIRRTSMSFLTALSLSFNNLMTKKGRTIMTAFAGSIGIIGIAAILSLANGVNNYIKTVEEETLSVYPLQINSTGFDMTAMMVGYSGLGDSGGGESGANSGNVNTQVQSSGEQGEGADIAQMLRQRFDVADTPVMEVDIMNRMFGSIASNDLKALKEYFDSNGGDIDKYVQSIEYEYNVTPYIFEANTEDGVQQINPDTSLSMLGIGSGTSNSFMMNAMMSTNVFEEMMSDRSMVEDQYDVVAGHWPAKYDECVLVLSDNGGVSDFMLYALGMRDRNQLNDMVRAFANNEEVEVVKDNAKFTYQDFLNLKMKFVCSADFYQRDDEHNVWVDKQGDEEYMKQLVSSAEDIRIAGIVQPRDDSKATALNFGIYYTPELTQHIIEIAGEKQIVKDQLADQGVNVFTGKPFGSKDEETEFDMSTMFTVNSDAIKAAFQFDTSKLQLDMSSMDVDFNADSLPKPPAFDPSAAMAGAAGAMGAGAGAGAEAGAGMGSGAAADAAQSSQTPDIDLSKIKVNEQVSRRMINEMMADIQKLIGEGKLDITKGWESVMQQYMQMPSSQAIIAKAMQDGLIDFSELQKEMQQQAAEQMQKQMEAMTQSLQAYMAQYMQQYMTELMTELSTQMRQIMSTAMVKAMSQLSDNMSSAMNIDADAFKNAFSFDMSEEELTELMMSSLGSENATFDSNLAKLDYAELDKPYGIDIYSKDFEAKQHVIDILDEYNDRMKSSGQEDKAITYTDIVGTMMKSVTTIIDMISYVLVAFVSISLIVSSIMIGVITYISVLERKKEIGILRAIGASKLNISEVFNAETVIEGLIAGLLGVGITALGCIPASAIVYSLFDVPNVAILPLNAAIVLVVISVVLTFISGLLPASSASRKDPVEALRSE